MTRRKPTNPWMRRHLRDPYVKQAVRSGYRSRAAFKLIEIDQRDRILKPGMVVVDLGASPGGWSQVASERVQPSGRVVAVDLLPMQPVPGVAFVHTDANGVGVHGEISRILGDARVDLVLSDMSPNLCGVAAVDEARSQALVLLSLDFARHMLKPGGCLLVKVFHGSGLEAVIREMRGAFAEVSSRKPGASRSESSEAYVLCRGFVP